MEQTCWAPTLRMRPAWSGSSSRWPEKTTRPGCPPTSRSEHAESLTLPSGFSTIAPDEPTMRYATVCIESIGYELPKHVVTSAEIEARLSPLYDRLQLPYGRLEVMSGIRERRFWDDCVNPSAAAALPVRKALVHVRAHGPEIDASLPL